MTANGSKAVKLRTNKCFPICPRKRTSDLRVNEYAALEEAAAEIERLVATIKIAHYLAVIGVRLF
jgi:hypothetical protein